MKKLKLNSNAFNNGEMLTRAQLKKVMGGEGSMFSCNADFDCGIAGHCIEGFCDNTYGGGSNCYDGNNGGCQPGRICVSLGGEIRCI